MKMIYGTSNKNKVKDLKGIIQAHQEDIEVISLREIGFTSEIEENGETFEENSEIKAKAVKEFCDQNHIAYDLITTDDAGLCVECLNGAPGVYSARYAGEGANQQEILTKLLSEIEKTKSTNRTAEFVCVLTTILKDGSKIISRGSCPGRVAHEVKEYGGLTYSPIFIPDGYDVPISELPPEEYEKAHNHRDKAFHDLIEEMKKRRDEMERE